MSPGGVIVVRKHKNCSFFKVRPKSLTITVFIIKLSTYIMYGDHIINATANVKIM